MKPIIEVSHLSKRYRIGSNLKPYVTLREAVFSLFDRDRDNKNTFWALEDISFTVEPGETIGIIGKNGAGKSTLLKILSRITPPTRGKAILRGRVASLLEVGTGFHPELTGSENIFLNGSILGLTRGEIINRFKDIVDFSGVHQFLDTPLKHYSSGMQLRLAFAVAAHLDPEILIIDEVLAVGDAEFQQKCLGKMNEVASSGRTVLFVSHNMAAVNKLCEKSILLEHGRIKAIDLTPKVFEIYLAKKEQHGKVNLEPVEGKSCNILSVGVMSDKEQFTDVIASDKLFYIYCKIQVNQPIRNSQVAISILSLTEGVVVFSSGHRDADRKYHETLEPDSYEIKLKVPGNFLNISLYAVNVRVWGEYGHQQRDSHADSFQDISFNIVETDSLASRFADKRKGVVTPLLEWQFS